MGEGQQAVPSVLVIDDNPADRDWCEIMLRRCGRFEHVLSLPTAVEALALYDDGDAAARAHGEHFPPSVILLDINLPAMDGFEFLAELAKRGLVPHVVLLVSDASMSRDQERAAKFPTVRELATKPLTEAQADSIASAWIALTITPSQD